MRLILPVLVASLLITMPKSQAACWVKLTHPQTSITRNYEYDTNPDFTVQVTNSKDVVDIYARKFQNNPANEVRAKRGLLAFLVAAGSLLVKGLAMQGAVDMHASPVTSLTIIGGATLAAVLFPVKESIHSSSIDHSNLVSYLVLEANRCSMPRNYVVVTEDVEGLHRWLKSHGFTEQ